MLTGLGQNPNEHSTPQEAKVHATLAYEHFNEMNTLRKNDIKNSLNLIEALTLLNREREAIVFATNAFKSSGDERLRLVSAKAMIQWSDRIYKTIAMQPLRRAEIIHRATSVRLIHRKSFRLFLDFLIEIGAKPDIATTLKHGLAIGKDAEFNSFRDWYHLIDEDGLENC